MFVLTLNITEVFRHLISVQLFQICYNSAFLNQPSNLINAELLFCCIRDIHFVNSLCIWNRNIILKCVHARCIQMPTVSSKNKDDAFLLFLLVKFKCQYYFGNIKYGKCYFYDVLRRPRDHLPLVK